MKRTPKTAARKPAKKRVRRSARRNSNPSETAAAGQLSEKFHGRPPRTITDTTETRRERFALAELGTLQELTVVKDDGRASRIQFTTKKPKLAVSPDGRQLYIEGGDQEIDLATLGITPAERRDHVELGALWKIVYRTSKGFHNFTVTDYVHEFGEEGGRLPTLVYETLNNAFYVIGGTYLVKPEGIVN
ncbi:MAG TPA: hypothetical protein VMV54_01195 [Acidocella sp.]|nr:hypothetical protein [Acidocella sp.]